MPVKLLTAVFGVFMFAAPVSAKFNAGVTPIVGIDDYKGAEVYGALSLGGVSISPEWKSYADKNSNGRVNTIQTRLAYDMRWFGMGGTAGTTLKKNGYSTTFGGADISFTLSPLGDTHIRRFGGAGRGGAPVGKGLARVDFGGGALVTRHEQKVEGSITTASDLTVTEYHGYVGASVLKILLSARLAKFGYSKSLNSPTAVFPLGQWTPIAGHLNYNNAYADTSLNLRVEAPIFPMIAPFASYTVTQFVELDPSFGGRPGDAKAMEVGLNVGLEMLAVRGSYQYINVSGPAKDKNFISVGASLRL